MVVLIDRPLDELGQGLILAGQTGFTTGKGYPTTPAAHDRSLSGPTDAMLSSLAAFPSRRFH